MQPLFQYVLDNFCLIYNISKEELSVGYHADDIHRLNIHQTDLSFFEEHTLLNEEDVLFKKWGGSTVPFLFFNERCRDDLWHQDAEGHVFLNADIIASAFYFLSGWEAYASSEKDELNRFPYRQSLQYKLDMPYLPVVNYYFDILKYFVEQTHHITLTKRLAYGEQRFACCVSHDVDLMEILWLQDIKAALKKGLLKGAIDVFMQRLRGRDIFFYIRRMLHYAGNLNYRPVFYFLPQKEAYGRYANADYDIEKKKYRQLMKEIRDFGCEIGMHGAFGTSTSNADFYADRSKLPAGVKGNRFHYLLWDSRYTVDILENNHIAYDSTMAFPQHIGLKNAYAHPFWLYDFHKKQTSDVIEIPMHIMDGSLFFAKYMNLSYDKAFEEISLLTDAIKSVGGVLVINWHTNIFLKYKWNEQESFFYEMLAYIQKEGAVFQTPLEINNALRAV